MRRETYEVLDKAFPRLKPVPTDTVEWLILGTGI